MMRSSPLRNRLIGCQMLGEDLPQLANRVDLDPTLRDVYGLPVARITYSPHRHELLASLYWARRLRAICVATGAERALVYPAALGFATDPTANNTRHTSGTLRMGVDPAQSVCDGFGRMHDADNVVVCDGSLFPTSGAMNPTLTIMATALRNATALAHGEAVARTGPITTCGHPWKPSTCSRRARPSRRRPRSRSAAAACPSDAPPTARGSPPAWRADAPGSRPWRTSRAASGRPARAPRTTP